MRWTLERGRGSLYDRQKCLLCPSPWLQQAGKELSSRSLGIFNGVELADLFVDLAFLVDQALAGGDGLFVDVEACTARVKDLL
jgi:hypothetical protein